MMRALTTVVLFLLGLVLGCSPVRAENWPRWRGPDGNAVSDAAPLPLHWSPTQNIRWQVAIPGAGFSSPIIWGQRIVLTSALEAGSRRAIHGLERGAAQLLWRRAIRADNPQRASPMTGEAAAVPRTDRRR